MPRRNLLTTLSLVVISLLAAFLAFGQQMTAVTGTIIGKDGKPVQGAEIRFDRTDIRANYNIKTNKDGKFNYATLPLGIYTITVRVNGEIVAQQEGIRTDPSKPIPIDLDLKKMAEAAATGAPAAAPVPEGAKGPSPEEIAAYEKAKAENAALEAKQQGLNDAFNTAMQAMQAKNWNVAIENFTKAGEIDATQHVVFAQLGEAYRERAGTQRAAAQIADFEKSAEAYAKAVAIKPDDPSYHNNYALALGRARKTQEARAEIDKAIGLDAPNAARYERNIARMFFDTNQTAAAEESFKKAIQLDPRNPEAYYQLGLVLISKATPQGKLADPAGTETAFKKYLELAPTGPEADNAKAMLQAVATMK
jgi:tetratricopeptide (TPR) repeat protein